MNKKIILMVLTIFFMMCITTGCGKTEIDLSQFISVNYEGIEGEGEATVDFDFPAFEDVIWQYEEETQETINWILTFEESVKLELDKEEKLSNGDTITATLSFNEETSKKTKYNFTGLTKEITINSLKEATVVDVFEGLEIIFKPFSISPFINISNITNKTIEINNLIDFKTEKRDNLKNGETIIVTATFDEKEVLQKGYVVEQKEKEITIDGLDEYISTFDQLNDEIKSELYEQALEHVNYELSGSSGYFGANYPEGYDLIEADYDSVEIQSVALKSTYFFYPKEIGKASALSGDVNNGLYFVYEANSTDCFKPEGSTCYVIVYFKDMIRKADGSYKIDKGYVVDSLTDWEKLYNEKIEANKTNYNVEEINK